MNAELKIVHDATDLLLQDGVALEKQLKDQDEVNKKLQDKICDIKVFY